MLDAVAKGFKAAKNRLAGKAELSEAVVDEALRDIRVALLEADVAFDVVKRFCARVKDKAVGEVVDVKAKDKKGERLRASPADHFVKICHDELEALMGPVDTSLKLIKGKTSGVMMVGLQGSGKTTTAAKLARFLAAQGHAPLLVAADTRRPAAVEQLKILGQKLQIPVFHQENLAPPELCRAAYAEAHARKRDVVLLDTAGRLAIDDEMMQELEAIKSTVRPDSILLVVDAMIGQDAVRTAAEFDRRLALDGFVLTKLDGDARGGAALSIKEITGKPVKFVGMGEALDRLEEFRPDGLASRILGFGDVVGLMKEFEQVVDEKKAEEDAEKILSGQFQFGDFVNQIRIVRKMGPVREMLDKFPIFGEMTESLQVSDKELAKIVAVHDSMTPREREDAEVVDASRARRIARGSGHKPETVKDVVGRYQTMRKMMQQVGSAPGLLARLPGVKQLAQLRQLQGKGLGDLFGDDAAEVEKAMRGPSLEEQAQRAGLPHGYTPPMGAGAMTRARLMGYSATPMVRPMSDEERNRLRDKRKRERQARKKNRRRR